MNHASQFPSVTHITQPIPDTNYAFAQMATLMETVYLHIFTYLANDPLNYNSSSNANQDST